MAGEMTIGAKLGELARHHPERTAIIDDGGTWSYRQFVSRITRFGHALYGLGLRKGDRVALLLPDVREYLEADYGTMSNGFVRVPIDPRMTRKEMAESLRHVDARALVTHASFAEKVEGLTSDIESLESVIGIGGAADGWLPYERLLEKAAERPFRDGDDDDLATLNFSGGTTGAPKATMLRHRNLLTAAQNMIHGFEIGPDAVFLNVRPLWPIAQINLMSHIVAGATVVLGRRFDPERFATLVASTGTTRTSLVPTQLVRVLDHVKNRDERLERLQAIHVGGSRIPTGIFEHALEVIGPKIGVLYGLTEAPVTCYLPPQHLDVDAKRQRRRMDSVGRVLSSYEVRIAASDQESETGARESGEVLIRGGHVMAGYWRDEEATRAALRDGWLHTGDVGQFDQEDNLTIVGRLKEVIRSGSSTIIPKEVEDVLVLHPAVHEAAVVGLPDSEWGEAVTAFVVVKPGMTVSENDLVEHCRAHLAGYKRPRSVRFVSTLPRSHYGKVLRAKLISEATE
jgi:acyl-CoA synthetase (AMP-forming)/AMP-acid ligase II